MAALMKKAVRLPAVLLTLGLVLLLVLAAQVPAFAQTITAISAEEAAARAEAGEILLVDVRTSQEWDQSGSPEMAFQNSMHIEGFFERLDARVKGNKAAPIALICASGNRSGRMSQILAQMGYETILDVSEGMYGSQAGAGWLAKGLPVTP